MDSGISLSTLLPGIKPGQFHAHEATRNELYDLINEKLIGEHSSGLNLMSADTMDQFKVTQWSEHYNSLWWNLSDEGELGEQAAGYLQQMVSERRGHAQDYLDDFFSLSNQLAEALNDQYPATTDLDQLLDNVAAGRKPSELADGSSLPKEELIEQFWQEKQAEIGQLNERYDNLKNAPTELQDWLNQNQIDRPLAMDRLIEKHQFSGYNGRFDPSEALQTSAVSTLQRHGDGDLSTQKPHLIVQTNYTDFLFDLGLRLGDAGMAKTAVAGVMMQQERQVAQAEYHQLYQPLAYNFYDQLGELVPRFSLQMLLDNLASDEEPGMLAGGDAHPDAALIADFAQQHADRLARLLNQQQVMAELPKTRAEWLADESNNAKAANYVYQRYGLEPWEQGLDSRLIRESNWLNSVARFENASPEMKARLLSDAQDREEILHNLFDRYSLGVSEEQFDFERMLDNFRFNRPLGLMADGSMHPDAEKLDAMFERNRDDFVMHIDERWLLDKQENLSMLDYQGWMNDDRKQGFADEILSLIKQSRAALNLDQFADSAKLIDP